MNNKTNKRSARKAGKNQELMGPLLPDGSYFMNKATSKALKFLGKMAAKGRQPNLTSRPQSIMSGGIPRFEAKEEKSGVANAFTVRQGPPEFLAAGAGSLRIKHSELVCDFKQSSSSSFAAGSYVINPGNAALFPWLAAIATHFEMYQFNKLKFIYVPMCATSEVGQLGLCFDPDAHDNTPYDKSVFASGNYKEFSSLHEPVSLSISGAAMSYLLKRRYVRSSTLGLDIATYDVGKLYWMLSQFTTNALGTLFVEYDVTLGIPEFSTDSDYYYVEGAINGTFNFANSPLGTVAPSIDVQEGNLPVELLISTGSFVRIYIRRPGVYQVIACYSAPYNAADDIKVLCDSATCDVLRSGHSGSSLAYRSPFNVPNLGWCGAYRSGTSTCTAVQAVATIAVTDGSDQQGDFNLVGNGDLWDSTHLAYIKNLATRFALLIVPLSDSWYQLTSTTLARPFVVDGKRVCYPLTTDRECADCGRIGFCELPAVKEVLDSESKEEPAEEYQQIHSVPMKATTTSEVRQPLRKLL